MIMRPQPGEYAPYAIGYIELVPAGSDLWTLLAQQPDELKALLQAVSDAEANTRPAPEEWSIKEVIGHINDTERIFAYRALRIARVDTTPLAGFEQDDYVRGTDFNKRPLADLVEEFACQRRANVLCFQALTEAEISRQGTASDHAVSTRALLFMLAGHVIHHLESLKTAYGIGG
ncbi:MAG TPA: DinB family protein [Phototrophicaceae bacterium]|nr:DinB family protein [Phototrophicaceae bacterium]